MAHIGTNSTGRFWGSRAAGVLAVARDTGRVLLLLRSPYVNEPGTWGIPGGAVNHDEDPAAAVGREFNEETGGTVTDLRPAHVFRAEDFEFRNFVGTVPTEFTPNLDWENSDWGWFDLDDLPSPLHFGVKSLLAASGDLIRTVATNSLAEARRRTGQRRVVLDWATHVRDRMSESVLDRLRDARRASEIVGIMGVRWAPLEDALREEDPEALEYLSSLEDRIALAREVDDDDEGSLPDSVVDDEPSDNAEGQALPVGTILYHGTSATDDFDIPDGPAWFTTDREVARRFVTYHEGRRPRILTFRVTAVPRLLVVRSVDDFASAAPDDDQWLEIVDSHGSSNELAEALCELEWDGWTIPANYGPSSPDIMLCWPEDYVERVD